jgi:hypothetical protein
MTILWVLLWVFALVYVTQTYYLAIMSLGRARAEGQIKPGTWQSIWFAGWLIPGVFCDWLLNMTVGTVLFLELPKSFGELLTPRLKRHCGKDGWRGWLATGICHKMLDKFDPRGRHC